MRKITFLKSLLLATMLMGGANLWGQVSTWTYSATLANNTIGSAFSGNVSGIVSVTLGADGDGANWQVLKTNSNNRGLAHNTNSVTITSNVPTAGTFVKISAIKKCRFVLNFYRATAGYLRMIDEATPATNIKNERNGGSGGNTNTTCELEAGHTYYIWYAEDSSGGNFSIQSFTATSYENYTIHYKDEDGTTIKSDVVHSGLYGASVSASGSDLDPIEYGGDTYAYNSGNTSITLSTGTNEITLVYVPAPKHNYTVNAVAGETTLKELVTGSTAETASYTASNLPLVIKYSGNYYVLTDANASGYSKSFTMGTSDEVKTVEYTLDESIVYFAEGEDLYAGQTTASDACSNGAYTYYLSGLTSTFPIADAGWYRMETVVMDRANKNPLNIYLEDDTDTALGTIAKGGNTGFRTTESFYVNASSNLKIGLADPSNVNTLSFDYVLVRRLPAPEGKFYLKNKANGGYFGAGLNYGTKAITSSIGHTVTLVYSEGKYTIDTSISNGGNSHYLNDVWSDGAAYGWIFTSDGAGYYTINNGTNNLTAGAVGAELTLTNGTGDNTKWQLLTEAEWKAENVARLDAATAANGVDATFYIPAANFNRNDNTENAKWQGSPKISGLSENSANTNYNAEKYNTTFDVYQELTGLKPGAYKLTMQGFYRNGDEADADATVRNAILYANSTETALVNVVSEGKDAADSDNGFPTLKSGKYIPNTQTDASKAFNNNNYNNELYVVVGADGNLRLGVKKTTAVNKDWTVFDNFQLTYYGNTVSGTITPAGWSSFASAYPLDLNTISGGTAYYASASGSNTVSLTSTTEKVAAGEGLMIKGTPNATFTINVAANGTAISGNLLKGQITTGNVAASNGTTLHYVFGYNNNDATEYGFYNLTSATEIPAGKAYLETTTTGGATKLRIVFDEATAIETVENSQAVNGKYYDLQGRLVAQPTKGLYIVNGKKVFIK